MDCAYVECVFPAVARLTPLHVQEAYEVLYCRRHLVKEASSIPQHLHPPDTEEGRTYGRGGPVVPEEENKKEDTPPSLLDDVAEYNRLKGIGMTWLHGL